MYDRCSVCVLVKARSRKPQHFAYSWGNFQNGISRCHALWNGETCSSVTQQPAVFRASAGITDPVCLWTVADKLTAFIMQGETEAWCEGWDDARTGDEACQPWAGSGTEWEGTRATGFSLSSPTDTPTTHSSFVFSNKKTFIYFFLTILKDNYC